jgi:DNA polymerase-3 subunit gamma/tau
MSHQVLARKWRPSSFRELVGQEHVLKALVNALDRDRLHHAYLFSGTRGVGKTTIARIFAKCLNCEQGVSSEPCGSCSACTEIAEGRFIDLIEVDAASRTKVEDTRDLLENVQYAPSLGRYKVYLIDEVHMLSTHSFNALLKTLEEPPPHVKFLLATTDPQKLPATILSRCLQFNLKNMSADRIVAHLQHVLAEEAVQCDEAALWLLAEAAQGSMRDALSLADQAIGYGAGTVVEQDVELMLGTIDRQAVGRILAAVISGDGAGLFAQVEQLAALGTDFQALLDELLAMLHSIAVAQAVPEIVPARQADTRRIGEFASGLSGEDLQIFYQMALNARRDFPYVPDPRRGFEMLALRLLTFRPVSAVEIAAISDAGAPAEQPATAAGQSGGDSAKKPEVVGAGTKCVGESATGCEPQNRQSRLAENSNDATAAIARSLALLKGEAGSTHQAAFQAAPVLDTTPALNTIPVLDTTSATAGKPAAQRSTLGSNAVPEVGDGGFSLVELTPAHWLALFPALNISGVTRSVVSNASLVSVQGETLHFMLDQEQAGLYSDDHRRRLQDALSEYFARGVSISIEQGVLAGESPALYRLRLKAERLQLAVDELQCDPNINLLENEFGGRLDTGTVQPLD